MAEYSVQKRVLTLCYEHPPLGGGGGKVARGLIDRLCLRGYSVDLITMRLPFGVALPVCAGLTVHQVDVGRRDRIVCSPDEMLPYIVRGFFQAMRLVRTNRYDVNFSHFLFPDGVICLALKKLTGLPYVITAHGSDVPGYNPHRFQLLHRLLKPVWRAVARNAASIVCPSQVVQRLVREQCPQAQTVVIPQCDRPREFVADRPKKPRILAVSRIVERKGHPVPDRGVGRASTTRSNCTSWAMDPIACPAGAGQPAFGGRDVSWRPAEQQPGAAGALRDRAHLRLGIDHGEFPAGAAGGDDRGLRRVDHVGHRMCRGGRQRCAAGAARRRGSDPAALGQLISDPGLCAVLGRRARARVEELYAWENIVARYIQVLQATGRAMACDGAQRHPDPVSTAPVPPA